MRWLCDENDSIRVTLPRAIMSAGSVCVTIGYRIVSWSLHICLHLQSCTCMHVGGCRLPVAEASRTSINFNTTGPRMEGGMATSGKLDTWL
jgi:hypothetical protein